jgi:hypothetical protein
MEGDHPARKIVISCDGDGCDQSYDNAAIAEGGGLLQMGWLTKFNDTARKLEHFCPVHKETPVE